MSYIIQCGDGYVGKQNNNAPYVVSDKTKAWIINNEEKANNIMLTLPKLMREKGTSLIFEEDLVTDKTIVNNKYIPVDMDSIKESICNLSNQFKVMKGNKDWLLEMESRVDKEISDILHYIEFYSFNACEGYKLTKELKELRLKRRDIKNQLQAINIISSHTCNMLTDGKTNKALCDIENKQYTPRILTELFAAKAD